MDRLDLASRELPGAHVVVLELDSVGGEEFEMRRLEPKGYVEAAGDTMLAVFGLKGEVVRAGKLRLWMVNHRYAVEVAGNGETAFLDPRRVGANSTVEVFEVERGGSEMVHVKTFSSGVVDTPNNLWLTGEGGFFVTNDHSAKGIWRFSLPSCHLFSM